MNGLELIKHTAGGGVMTATTTGGSVKLLKNGKIEFTNATEVHVDKCFDVPADSGDEPLYDNYLMVMKFSSEGANNPNIYVRMRSGTDNIEAKYTTQRLIANGSSVTGNRDPDLTYALIGASTAGSTQGMHLYLYGPNLTQPTAGRSVTLRYQNNTLLSDWSWTHGVGSAYNGMTIMSNALSGSLTIYGFTKGGITK